MTASERAAFFTQEQEAFVGAGRVARLATADPRGIPSNVPVCYAFSGTRFYIALDDKPKSVPPARLKRVRNITGNPRVALLIDSYNEDWSRLRYVLVNGEAALLEPGGAEHSGAVALLRDKYPQYREMPIESRALIAVTPLSVHGWSGQTAAGGEDGAYAEGPTRLDLSFAALARGRHVVRRFKPVPVPRELVEHTIEAAGWAPSPHGAQPWRFVVITNSADKERLAEAMAAEWRRNLEMDEQEPGVLEERLRKSRSRITGSPVLVVPCLYMEEMHIYPDPARREAELTMAVQSLGCAVQNMMLSAYSLGLDTGWMCAPLFCPGVVRDTLGLPASLTPHALINMGYGAADPPRRPHRPTSELIFKYD